MNKCIFIGRLTKETELKSVSNTNILNNSLAVSRRYKNANGENIEEVLFLDFTAFGKLAEIMATYLHKGSKAMLSGYLKLETWQDNNGNTRQNYKLIVEELEMLDNKPTEEKTQNKAQNQNGYNQQQPTQKAEQKVLQEKANYSNSTDEEIPF